ncbi:MAG: hypothetical protein P8Y72_01495 [Anaerolineales bacterium]|jgi:hypothetical protein
MNIDPVDIRDMPAGSVGALGDSLPLLTVPIVRPYIIAILLHRGAVTRVEVLHALTGLCCQSDIRVGGWDPYDEDWCEGTRVEKVVDLALGEMVAENYLRYNPEKEIWVLTPDNLGGVISWAAATGSRIPTHLLIDMGRDQLARLPDFVHFTPKDTYG